MFSIEVKFACFILECVTIAVYFNILFLSFLLIFFCNNKIYFFVTIRSRLMCL